MIDEEYLLLRIMMLLLQSQYLHCLQYKYVSFGSTDFEGVGS